MLLGKDELNINEVLISKALIDSCISHNEFVSVNNLLGEYYEMKKGINPKNSVEKQWKPIVSVVKNMLLTKIQVSGKQNRLMILSNCAVCAKKKSTCIKNKDISND